MSFSRRFFFSRLLPGLAGGAAASQLVASPASAVMPVSPVQKVVYHVSEPSRVNFALGNIKNHIEGKGGPDKVKIVLVVHGSALDFFIKAKSNPGVVQQTKKAHGQGVELVACGNTMKAKEAVVADLLEGFSVAEEGGVVRIADLQEQGYVYIRP